MCVCARGEAGPLSVCCVEELPSLKIVTGMYVISSPVVKQCVCSVYVFVFSRFAIFAYFKSVYICSDGGHCAACVLRVYFCQPNCLLICEKLLTSKPNEKVILYFVADM